MPEIIFARPRYEYGSYSDLHRLIPLSGYPLIYCDEIDSQSDNCYIYTVANGENRAGWPEARARIIFWQLEFQDGPEPLAPGVSEIWTSDPVHAKRIDARYVPLGSHVDLNLEPGRNDVEKVFDVATLWAPSGRRYNAHGDLEAHGVKLAPTQNLWGKERHQILQASRAMVEVRQWDQHPFVGAQRWALAAAYHLPMITETLFERGLFGQAYCLMSDLHHIGAFTQLWMKPENARLLVDFGENLHNLLCRDFMFRQCVEVAV